MSTKRVRYREDQRLTNRDLNDEQSYRIKMRRRHNIAHHSWGIVQGLRLITMDYGVVVSPGFAVDGFGRELVVPQELTLTREVFDHVIGNIAQAQNKAAVKKALMIRSDSEVEIEQNDVSICIDIWLTYCSKPSSFQQPNQASRVKEEAMIKLQCANPDIPVNPYSPSSVSVSEGNVSAYDELEVEQASEWPVYLGRIMVHSSPNLQEYEKIETIRLEVGLIGAAVQNAEGGQWLQLGDEEANDNKRFSIMLADNTGNTNDYLKLDQNGDISLQGRLSLESSKLGYTQEDGDLRLHADYREFLADNRGPHMSGLEFKTPKTASVLATPWQIYRTVVKRTINDQEISINQLRFETFNPGEEEGVPARYEWNVIDPTKNTEQAILSVRSDNTVVVNANLEIQGKIIEGAIPADLRDQRFRDELLSRWTKGLTIAGSEVDAFYELPLYVSIDRKECIDPQDPQESKICYVVSIEYIGKDADREIPILAVVGEVRNADRQVVFTMDLTSRLDSSLVEISASGTIEVLADSIDKIPNAKTFDVHVYALGLAQNTIIKSANYLIKQTNPANGDEQ